MSGAGMARPMVISSGLIAENVPRNGQWKIRCPDCSEMLTFAYRDRGSSRSTLIVSHGEGEARLEIPGHSDDNLLWAIGIRDPLGAWLDRLHDYEDGKQ